MSICVTCALYSLPPVSHISSWGCGLAHPRSPWAPLGFSLELQKSTYSTFKQTDWRETLIFLPSPPHILLTSCTVKQSRYSLRNFYVSGILLSLWETSPLFLSFNFIFKCIFYFIHHHLYPLCPFPPASTTHPAITTLRQHVFLFFTVSVSSKLF